ncbi:AraC family transcriptional regulator [Conexibacter woesei]|uniref:Transcriptional regulator, AraC family n=1 Tax=Conexibacter woesei (strain DSM 14684 / CCUG 47730 / CIP 108061 / JCM 11494 / NBRC 100937 / ID131577) TaxID=469383 RepID=D3FBG7_CONWI|nr:AraC family transcriptional regulator [Conexibacter woesei]ADB49336.1 transcriptional regulator, AraC family [Conexibacter woesei DSM 14684]
MDAIAGLLDGPRARGAFLLRAIMAPPWSMRIEDRAPLTLVALVEGDAWVVPDGGDAVRLRPGDVAIARGPDHYTIADDPASATTVVVEPGQRCMTLSGEDLAEPMSLGVRTWGNSASGPTTMLIGTYQLPGEISQRLLAALPPLVVLPADAWDSPLIPLLRDEIGKDEPGQEALLDRLLDLLLIAVLRVWFSRPEADAPGWYRAQSDPVVGRALKLLQNNPAHPWTVATLAAEVGISRAALARRFAELVGEPPMAFLTEWRLALAADLLLEPDATIGSVAQQVGYGSSFALSTAFKRVRGTSPQAHRVGATHQLLEAEGALRRRTSAA